MRAQWSPGGFALAHSVVLAGACTMCVCLCARSFVGFGSVRPPALSLIRTPLMGPSRLRWLPCMRLAFPRWTHHVFARAVSCPLVCYRNLPPALLPLWELCCFDLIVNWIFPNSELLLKLKAMFQIFIFRMTLFLLSDWQDLRGFCRKVSGQGGKVR